MKKVLAVLAALAFAFATTGITYAADGFEDSGRVLIAFGGDIEVAAGEQADAVVVISGDAHISGTVTTLIVADGTASTTSGAALDSITVFNGTADLASGTTIRGDVNRFNSTINRADGVATDPPCPPDHRVGDGLQQPRPLATPGRRSRTVSYQAIVAIVVVVGVLAGILLLILAWRRIPSSACGQRGSGETAALGMSLGMLFGAALGTIVWLSTDQFVFWVVFMGGGMTLGRAIGQARANRSG